VEQIFEVNGESHIRMIEQEALKEVSAFDGDFVISSGGGTSCFYGSIDYMNSVGWTVYLRMEVASLVARLLNSKNGRPLLLGNRQGGSQ
jgi:shikimate kinase